MKGVLFDLPAVAERARANLEAAGLGYGREVSLVCRAVKRGLLTLGWVFDSSQATAMAEAGAFGQVVSGQAYELAYWHMTGGFQAGELRTLFKGDEAAIGVAVRQARDALCALIDAYDAPDRSYLSQPQPGLAPRYSDYAQLARVAEWVAAGDEE